MKNNFRSFILIFFTSIFLFSCSQKNNNIDLDLSNLPKPKSIKSNFNDQLEEALGNEDNQLFIKQLIPFEDRKKLLSKYKFGKKDPFSAGETQLNQFSSNFKLKGFLNTKMENFVFVSYQGNEGAISEDSVGGLNTNLLPNGAKVKTIDPKNRQLKISFNNEDFTFELKSI